MKKQQSQDAFNLFFTILVIGIVSRLIPHPWNVTPMAGLALFSGYVFKNRVAAFLAPIFCMYASNLFLGMYDWRIMLITNVAIALPMFFGTFLKRTNSPVLRLIAVAPFALLGSFLFYLLSNSAVWAFGTTYPKTMSGLSACLAAGLPFLKATLTGDIIYSYLFMSAAFLLTKPDPSKTSIHSEVPTPAI